MTGHRPHHPPRSPDPDPGTGSSPAPRPSKTPVDTPLPPVSMFPGSSRTDSIRIPLSRSHAMQPHAARFRTRARGHSRTGRSPRTRCHYHVLLQQSSSKRLTHLFAALRGSWSGGWCGSAVAPGRLRGGAAGGEQDHERVPGAEHLVFGDGAQALEQARHFPIRRRLGRHRQQPRPTSTGESRKGRPIRTTAGKNPVDSGPKGQDRINSG